MKSFEINYMTNDGFEGSMPVEPEDHVLNLMYEPEEIVHTNEKRIRIQFRYPLSTEVILDFDNPRNCTNWTRREIFDAIRKGYNEIYYHEDIALESDPQKTPYGIWGHSIYDLVVENVHVNKKGILELSIGS